MTMRRANHIRGWKLLYVVEGGMSSVEIPKLTIFEMVDETAR